MKYLVLDVGNLADEVLEPDEVLDTDDETSSTMSLRSSALRSSSSRSLSLKSASSFFVLAIASLEDTRSSS